MTFFTCMSPIPHCNDGAASLRASRLFAVSSPAVDAPILTCRELATYLDVASGAGYDAYVAQPSDAEMDPRLCAERGTHGRSLEEVQSAAGKWEATPVSVTRCGDTDTRMRAGGTQMRMRRVAAESFESSVLEMFTIETNTSLLGTCVPPSQARHVQATGGGRRAKS